MSNESDTPTPRTDSAAAESNTAHIMGIMARTLERELNAAQARIAELEERLALSEDNARHSLIEIEAMRDDEHRLNEALEAERRRTAEELNCQQRAHFIEIEKLETQLKRSIDFIKELNATTNQHGRHYRSRCGQFLATLNQKEGQG